METELEESRCLVVGRGYETRERRLGMQGKDESGRLLCAWCRLESHMTETARLKGK